MSSEAERRARADEELARGLAGAWVKPAWDFSVTGLAEIPKEAQIALSRSAAEVAAKLPSDRAAALFLLSRAAAFHAAIIDDRAEQ